MICKKVISGLLSFAMVVISVFTGEMGATVNGAEVPSLIAAYSGENVTEDLAVEYDLTKIVDGKIADKTGHGNDATVQGATGISFIEEDGKTVMVMASNDSYLELPTSIMDSLTNKEQFTIETKFAKSKKCGGNAWLFCFGSNVKSTGTNYLFLSPNFNSTTLRAGIKNSSSEKLFGTSIRPVIDEWYTVDMVFDEGVVKVYWDGVLIQGDNGTQLDSGYSIMDDVVTPGTSNNILGYIGKSCWKPDKNYQGKIASFKIYDKAMTDEEVQLSNPEYLEKFRENLGVMEEEDVLAGNASASEVKYNVNLATAINEIDVTWSSSNEDVITSTGIVKNGATDQKVTLTATMTSGALSASKNFTFIVKALDKTELEAVIAEAQTVAAYKYADPATTGTVLAEIDQAATAATQTQVDNAVKKIRKAMNKVELLDVYANPFVFIDDSKLVPSVDIRVGGTATVFTLPKDIKDMVTVSYASTDATVATVSADGVVTGVKDGHASVVTTVTANYDGFAMEYQTLVKVGTPTAGNSNTNTDTTPKKVTVSAAVAKRKIVKGQSTQITVTAPKDAVVKYRAKGAVAVTSTGKVTGKKGGTGTVYAIVTVSGKTVTRKVTVNVGGILGKSTVKVKKSLKLRVNGLSGKATWSVNKTKLATINKNTGVLKAKKKGKVVVTAKVGKYTMKKTITINK